MSDAAAAARPLASHIDAPAWRAWCLILALLAGAPFAAMVFAVTQPILPAIATGFGTGTGAQLMAQLFTTMPDVGLVAGGLIGGLMVDRLGARPVWFGALIVYAVAGSAGMYVENPVLLLISRLLLGFASIAFTTASYWIMGTIFSGQARMNLLGYRQSLAGIAGLAAVLASGAIAEAYGWRASFIIYLAAGLLVAPFAIVSARMLKMPPRAPEPAAKGSLIGLWKLYLGVLILGLVGTITVTQMPFLLAQHGFAGPAVISYVVAVARVATMLSAFLFGWINSRLGAERTLILIGASMSVGLLIMGASTGVIGIGLGSSLMGISAGLYTPYFANQVLERAPEAIRGRAVGLVPTAIYVGNFLNPVLFLPLRQALGIGPAMVTVALLMGAGLVVLLVLHRRRAAAV